MKFLVDADLPESTARVLSAAGHVASHVNELGLGSAPIETSSSMLNERVLCYSPETLISLTP